MAIVASTGFHLRQYYGSNQATYQLSEAEAARLFERDLKGAGDAGIRAGIVKAAHPGTVHDVEFRRLLAASCRAGAASGAAMQVHTERGEGVEALADTLEAEGADPRRVILSHMDKRPDLQLHLELAARGYLLEYDTFLRPKYRPAENVWPLLARALESGLNGAIACGLDLADPTMWQFAGAEQRDGRTSYRRRIRAPPPRRRSRPPGAPFSATTSVSAWLSCPREEPWAAEPDGQVAPAVRAQVASLARAGDRQCGREHARRALPPEIASRRRLSGIRHGHRSPPIGQNG